MNDFNSLIRYDHFNQGLVVGITQVPTDSNNLHYLFPGSTVFWSWPNDVGRRILSLKVKSSLYGSDENVYYNVIDSHLHFQFWFDGAAVGFQDATSGQTTIGLISKKESIYLPGILANKIVLKRYTGTVGINNIPWVVVGALNADIFIQMGYIIESDYQLWLKSLPES